MRWESYVVPLSIQEVVDAIFSLPPDELREPDHPPNLPAWRVVHARVLGRRFVIAGEVNTDGDWLTVEVVAPVWPPDLG
jgi:hypothetical protein